MSRRNYIGLKALAVLLLSTLSRTVFGYLPSLDKEGNELIDKLVATTTPDNGSTNWKLHKFGDDSKTHRAVCLDGSPAGFWFSEGSGEGKDKYVIHHMGGGWCSSVDDCIRRSKQKTEGDSVALGSSDDWKAHVTCEAKSPFTDKDIEDMDQFDKKTTEKGSLPCYYDGGQSGLLSYNSIENPLAYNWNKVYVPYCDGASFSGDVEKPVGSNKTKGEVYFRGKAILNAVYDTLLSPRYNMGNADDIILSGSSAGGLAVILHADTIADKIHKHNGNTPNIAGIPDAAFFMDVPSTEGENRMVEKQGFKDLYNFQNIGEASDGALKRCHSYFESKGTPYKCLLPQYLLSFVKTPMFFTQSYADAYQFPNVMALSCGETSCNSKAISYVNKFRHAMMHYLDSSAPKSSGYWVTGCQVHTMVDHSKWFAEGTVDGMEMRYAVYGWYSDNFLKKRSTTWKYVDEPWNHNGAPEKCSKD